MDFAFHLVGDCGGTRNRDHDHCALFVIIAVVLIGTEFEHNQW